MFDRLVDRLQIGLETDMGSLLIGLLGLFGLFLFVFLALAIRQKRKDILAHRYRAHYENALAKIKDFTVTTAPKAGFFGRETVGTLPSGEFGFCCIPTPDMADDMVRVRFRDFLRSSSRHNLPLFAPIIWKHSEELLITVQGQLVKKNGHFLANVNEIMMDSSFANTDVEETLLELARALAALHKCRGARNQPLYHGFLLPRSVFLDFGANKTIDRLVVADLGMAYAMGPERVFKAVNALQQGKYPMERYAAQDTLAQLACLAPEQRDPQHFSQVGAPSDFFSFAALAVSLFTRKRFLAADSLEWTEIPEQWRAFLQACLKSNPKDRPQDFLELEDWLEDPELGLTHKQNDSQLEATGEALEDRSFDELSGMLDRVKQQTEVENAAAEKDKVQRLVRRGNQALEQEKWSEAKQAFGKAVKAAPGCTEAWVGVAISFYELGDLKKADQAYATAKKQNEATAKRFRQHIAFRV